MKKTQLNPTTILTLVGFALNGAAALIATYTQKQQLETLVNEKVKEVLSKKRM